jgi:hypothetical protein
MELPITPAPTMTTLSATTGTESARGGENTRQGNVVYGQNAFEVSRHKES